MSTDYARKLVRRSRLFMPVTQKRYVEKAYERDADAVVLDLEDSVPPQEKVAARSLIREGIALAGRGGSDVGVRVNNVQELLVGDLDAAILPGLNYIILPKVEKAEEVLRVDAFIARLEQQRDMPVGTVTINALIESPVGYLNMDSIAASSPRIDCMTLANEDFCKEIGITSDKDTEPSLRPLRMQLVVVARAYKKMPLGLLGSTTHFAGEEDFKRLARLSYKNGFLGSSCIHPGNVAALNAAFTPSAESIAKAREIIAAMEKALAEGKGAISLHGSMVDIPHYNQAKELMERVEIIAAFDAKKRKARESV